MKKILTIAAGIVLGFVVLIGGCAAILGGTTAADDPGTPVSQAADESPEAETKASSPKPKAKPKAKPETAGQRNARESALEYLDYSSFSRSGLIEQLKFEGYSTADATYGVDILKVGWNEQAALKAQEYLDTSPFSRNGLFEQLRFEGYTEAQAQYGVNQAGL